LSRHAIQRAFLTNSDNKSSPSKQLFEDGLNDLSVLSMERDVIMNRNWLPLYGFIVDKLSLDLNEEASQRVMDELTLRMNHVQVNLCKNICLICDAPTKVNVNEEGLLNGENGPAMEFKDGYRVFCRNGVTIPAAVIENPSEITVSQIGSERNVEVRRILIQQYGLEKYLADSGAVVLDSDQYGVLYKREQDGEEPMVVVKVTNSTQEPGEPPKHYFLRVPPYMRTAKDAVAWTFQMDGSDYTPTVQS
ncbi:MAG: hypothetical protein K2Z81_28055, partial [Cyanobacteria bacterium]|nr:hypothetical protein [Cyanobacteriota bacterium]